jgi:hypothetical protein
MVAMGEVNELQFAQNSLRQFLQIWVEPEIVRRQATGLLPKPAELSAFQILWYPDGRPHLVRINDEVKAQLRLKLDKTQEPVVGQDVAFTADQVEWIALADHDDPDCGHATYFTIGGRWIGQFDAIYNKGLSRSNLNRGNEFLVSSEQALHDTRLAAFVANCFCAAELFAKARLLLLAEFGFRKKSSHKGVAQRLNYHFHIGNLGADGRNAFNRLANLRDRARYLHGGDLQLSNEEARELLNAVTAFRDETSAFLGRLQPTTTS